MARPVTLFTGQWADLPLDDLAALAAGWGYDGLELACWGDHFDVAAALADPGYAKRHRELLERHGLGCWALGAHLVGQGTVGYERVLPAALAAGAEWLIVEEDEVEGDPFEAVEQSLHGMRRLLGTA